MPKEGGHFDTEDKKIVLVVELTCKGIFQSKIFLWAVLNLFLSREILKNICVVEWVGFTGDGSCANRPKCHFRKSCFSRFLAVKIYTRKKLQKLQI